MMKTYPISSNPTEIIDFKVDDDRYSLVQTWKYFLGDYHRTIIMNKREVLNLYQALQEEILKPKGEC